MRMYQIDVIFSNNINALEKSQYNKKNTPKFLRQSCIINIFF